MNCRTAITCLAGLSVPAYGEGEGVRFFREEVKPILEQQCFRCHGGTDDKGQLRVRGGLQLISRKGLLKGGDHGPAFDETDPRASLILHALSYENEDLQMPPRGKLSGDEIGKIARWLEMGAPWTPEDADRLVEIHDPLAGVTTVNEKTKAHWSYRPMTRPEPPATEDAGWAANPIDAFLRAGMAERGVAPAPEASRAALLRRLTYTLTGLPPTLEEIRAFERDPAPDAWEKQIERLLDSPAYGEKWARHWLDLVRYAESNGFERDNDKPFVWRYRDYVVRAFNEDKPYDRFVMEQIAGDELPDKTAESQIATGIFRLMAWDDEPSDRKQHFYDVLDDNVRTVTEGFLAMTIGCARCHDHKGDPIPQSDYFRFAAFLRGIEPMGSGGVQTRMIDSPELRRERDDRLAELETEESSLREFLAQCEEEALEKVRRTHPEIAAQVGDLSPMDRWLVTDVRLRPTSWHYTTARPPEDWSAVSFRADQAHWQEGLAAFGTAVPGMQAHTVWTTSDIWLQTTFGLEKIPESVLIHLYHDEDIDLYLNGQPVLRRSGYVTDYERIPAPREFMAALQTGRNVLAAHIRQTGGGQFFDLGLEIDTLIPADLVLKEEYDAVPGEIRRQYRESSERLSEIVRMRESSGIEALIVTERGPHPPPTHIHIRGSAHAEGDEVRPGYPAIWGGQDAEIPAPAEDAASSGRRLALARWMTSPDHPRTARVMVNRIWQHHFGRGLAPTPNDFGFLGIAPTHPELLDWLATEFVRRGWSVKEMHRLILRSRAYRASIREDDAGLAKDPGNDTFRRFTPRRLSAEELRDSILAGTGELNPEMGGPSVFIPMPAEVLATSSTKGAKWGESPPGQANRRSIYVKVKRSLQAPLFADFDGADTDNSCPSRFTTTVPTQALAMMNSEFVHEKAAALARRLEQERPGDLRGQIERAFEVALSRPPGEEEIARSMAFVEKMKKEHRLDDGHALQRFAVAVFSFNEFFYLD